MIPLKIYHLNLVKLSPGFQRFYFGLLELSVDCV